MHLFMRKNFVRTKRLNLVKKSKSKLRIFRGWEVQTQKITITIIYISLKNLLTKNDLAYKYYINLVEAIIRHQKLRPTCRE